MFDQFLSNCVIIFVLFYTKQLLVVVVHVNFQMVVNGKNGGVWIAHRLVTRTDSITLFGKKQAVLLKVKCIWPTKKQENLMAESIVTPEMWCGCRPQVTFGL